MKKQILNLMITAAVLTTTPVFAMDIESQHKISDIDFKKLVELTASQEKENTINRGLIKKDHDTLLVRMPNGNWRANPIPGKHDDFIASEKKLAEISQDIGHTKAAYGEERCNAVLENSEILSSQAKEGNPWAQDELMRRNYLGLIILRPKNINFASEDNLKDRSLRDDDYADRYAYFAISHDIKIPGLFHKVKERADQGVIVAQHNLGRMYVTGYEVDEKSEEKDKIAVQLLTNAANNADAGAQDLLAWMHENGRGVMGGKSGNNDKIAFDYYAKAANQNYIRSQGNLGRMYKNGLGVPVSFRLATQWLTKAADQGDDDAQCLLGIMYLQNEAVNNDREEIGLKAEKISLALFSINPITQPFVVLGCWLKEEGYLEQTENDKTACALFLKAADQGNSYAKYNLAWMYERGRGSGGRSEINEKLSIKWSREAAEEGNKDAQYKLGLSYVEGRGIEKNYIEGLRWLIQSKTPPAKTLIHSSLLSRILEPITDTKGSFKEMLDEILCIDIAHVLATQNDQTKVKIEGLTAVSARHFAKKQANNDENPNWVCIPELYKCYNKIEDIENEFFQLIVSLKINSTPGFMITAYEPSDELKKSIVSEKEPSFLSINTFKKKTYFSLGEQNVSLAQTLIGSLESIDKKFDEIDGILNTISQSYKMGYQIASSNLKTKQLVAEHMNQLSKDEQLKYRKINEKAIQLEQLEKWTQQECDEIEKDRAALNAERDKIKNLIPVGAVRRNKEFYEEYPFLQ